MYERSLVLNPDKINGKEVLGELADAA